MEVDQDHNNFISFAELKTLLHEIRFRNSNWDKDKKIAEVMKEFDLDGDKNVTMDEFVVVFSKWLEDMKSTMDKRYHSVDSKKDLYQVKTSCNLSNNLSINNMYTGFWLNSFIFFFMQILQPWIQNQRKEHEMKKELVSEIIGHVQSSALGSLYKDGRPDINAIKR